LKLTFATFLLFSVCTVHAFAQSTNDTSAAAQFKIIDSGKIFNNPPFKNCHAVTIVETAPGTFLYAWFGGDQEGAKNVCIWGCYRYTNQQKQWGEIILLAKGQDSSGVAQPCWNPVLFKTAAGVLSLDYKVGPNPREWWAERKISNNNGRTWSASVRLPSPFLGPIKNKPVQLSSGTILYASSTESKDESWQIHLETSDAESTQWQYIAIECGRFDVIQPTILTYGDEWLQMLCRSKQNTIVQTWSYDKGATWSNLAPVNLPNPNSGIDAVTLRNGLQLLVYNPMKSGKDWSAGRSVLKVAVSKNGHNWEDILTLEDHTTGEYSYPAVIQDSRGVIRIAYTDDRKNMKFVDLEEGR
jgi:predicted neuraminidase